jgi:iron complex outermembrane receptor protein
MKWTSIVKNSVCLFALTSAIAWAQGSISIGGVVKDPDGAVVAGASVSLISQDNTTRVLAISDQRGHYEFDHLSQGRYLLSVTANGMESSLARVVDTTAGPQANVDLQLRLLAVTTSVSVTASGTAQTSDETAKSVSVVDSETIENLDTNTVADSLNYVPGLRVQEQGGPGGLVSIKTRGLRDQDTAVLVDGFRLRDASAITSDASSIFQDLLLTDTDRIEVLRGTGSSLYGTDATGGVINVITGTVGGKTRGSVLLEGGSMTTFRGRAGISGSALNSKLGYSAGIAHLNVVQGLDGSLPDRTSGAQGRFDYAPGSQTHIAGRLFVLDSYGLMTQSPSALPSASSTGVTNAVALSASQLRLYENGTPIKSLSLGNANFIPDYDDPDSTRAARIYSGALTVSSHPSDSLSLAANYQGLYTHRNFTNGPAGIGYQPYGGKEIDLYDGLIHTASGRLDWRLGKHQLINAGYEFENENYQENTTMPSAADNYSTNVSQRYNAFFAQDQVYLLDGRLQLAASYRSQFFNLGQPTFVPASGSPYAGLKLNSPPTSNTWDASSAYLFRQSGTKLRAHVGTGYRAPSLYERFGTYYDSYYGYSNYGDPELQPERTIAGDGGIDQKFWNGRAEASATYFYTRLRKVIFFSESLSSTDPYGRYIGYTNTNGGIARGVESSFAITPVRKLNVRASYTFNNARETTPSVAHIYQTFRIPDHQFSLLVTGQLTPSFSVVFGTVLTSNYLDPVYNSATYSSQAFRFPGQRKGQLGADYRRSLGESRAVRLFVNVNNAFNQAYYESGYRTPGATAMSGLQFDF